jgi:transcriptional regulator with XRE-family HTH domain
VERDARALGDVLRALREERGLTQERLGFAAKVTKNYVSDVEGARRNPTVRIVGRLLRAMDVSWTEFGRHFDAMRREPQR